MRNHPPDSPPDRWEILKRRVVYEHPPWLRLIEEDVRLPNGTVIEKYLLTEIPDVVMMFAVTQAAEAIFVEQYKHGMQGLSLDLSAGYIDEGDASPLTAAQRELQEETGYVSDRWTPLASLYMDPNRSGARIHYFLARDCRLQGEQHLDATEDLRVRLLPLSEVPDLALSGSIQTTSTGAGIALGLHLLSREKSGGDG